MPISSRVGRDLVLTACAAGLFSALWIASVPAFEGLDELYFYNRAIMFSAEPSIREPIFFRLASVVLRLQPRPAGPVEPRYNPAFEFVGNQRGSVTRFEHERPVAPRGHVRTLYALRVLVAALAVLTALCIYGIARLALGRGDVALAVALTCIAVPQFSFMNAVVHGEAMTRLFGAAASLVVVAGVVGAIRRPAMWIALAILVVMTPLIDRQGFFVVALAGAGAVMVEPTWRRRLIAVLLIVVPVLLVPQFIERFNEAGNLGPWFQLLRHPIRPLLYADPAFGSNEPPGAPYYVFEFLPKLFMSFWGWLGQPSILMPPPVYAALAVVSLVGAAGAVLVLASGRSELIGPHVGRLAALRVLAFGIAAMCVPIVYGPALAGLNLWYGRWLFPMIGPIVLLLGVGWAAVLETRRRRRRMAAALGLAAALAAVLWMTSPGAEFRAAVETYHYGARAHLVLVSRDTIAALAIAAALLALTNRWKTAASLARSIQPATAAAVALNLLVLVVVVQPLYARLEPEDFVAMVRRDVAAGRMSRAAEVFASAVKIYPDSPAIRSLSLEAPRLLISGRLDEMTGLLQEQLAHGAVLEDRDTLLALARYIRTTGLALSDAVERALDTARADPQLAEPAELVRLALARAWSDPDAAAKPIAAGGGRPLHTPMRGGEATLEGATVHTIGGGRVQVVVYFRPGAVDWTNHRIWLHAYPDATPEKYLDPEPVIAPSAVVKPGELEWAVFELPPGHYQGYVGIWVGTTVGSSSAIGPLP